MIVSHPEVDRLLQRNPELVELVREIEWLMAEHQRLVAEGKIPAYKLMGLHKEGQALSVLWLYRC